MTLLIIGLCGLLGIFSRYAVDIYVSRFAGPLPIGTWAINVVGSFIAGLVLVAGAEKQLLSPEWRTGLMVGFCGGFTTFSAYTVQTIAQWEAGAKHLSLLYFVLSPLTGLLCAVAGVYLGRCLFSAT